MIEQIGARGGDPDRIVAALAEALRREFGPEPKLPLQIIQFQLSRPR